MRISDWSSDVCSSDLIVDNLDVDRAFRFVAIGVGRHDVDRTQINDVLVVGVRMRKSLQQLYLYRDGIGGPRSNAQWRDQRQPDCIDTTNLAHDQIGRASCRERVCQYV